MTLKKVPCTIMRGGTSKGVFFRREALPSDDSKMTEAIMEIFGSGDPMQIDGLGGTHTQTSKTMVVWKSDRKSVDVDYLFGQVGVERRIVDYTGNCGNLTSAVGPFAVDEEIVRVAGSKRLVRLYNVNTNKRVDALISLEDGKTVYDGDYTIDGVPNPGARIDVTWHEPEGSLSGKLLPTGDPLYKATIAGEEVECSIVDAANPVVFVRAKDVGMTGTELPNQVREETLEKLEKIRSRATRLLGLVKTDEEATAKSGHIPFIAVVGEVQDYASTTGKTISAGSYNLLARLFSIQKMHHAYAVTGAICTAVAARISGTIVNQFYKEKSDKVIIGHPKGVIDIGVKMRPGETPKVESVIVARTARRLMSGTAFYHDR
jgi:hypothetical protein